MYLLIKKTYLDFTLPKFIRILMYTINNLYILYIKIYTFNLANLCLDFSLIILNSVS